MAHEAAARIIAWQPAVGTKGCALMKNLPISIKFLAVLGMLAVFTIASLTFVSRQMYGISARAVEVNGTVVRAAGDISDAASALEKMRAAMEYILITSSGESAMAARRAVIASQLEVDEKLGAASAAVPAQRAQMEGLRHKTDALLARAECQEIENLPNNWPGNASQMNVMDFGSGCAPGFVPLSQAMEAERGAMNTLARLQLAALAVQTRHTVFMTFLSVIAGFVLVALVGYFGVGAWVVRPLAGLRAAMERLARGDFAIKLDAARNDEVGAMARSVQVFLDAAREKERLEAAAAAAAREAMAERERAEAGREAAAAAQALVVESVADGLERLSSGDLLYRISNFFAPEYEKLRMDFNQAMETLEKTMQGIAATTQGVRASAMEITRSSDDLARRTEHQAASLEETAAAVVQINGTVSKTANGANEARDVVNEAKKDAERSGVVVNATVTAMREIEVSSKQISSIIGVIDEIAFQTNLLALNAGVEAARAGDAGRGFAVVATEVRALAQRSADAAKEIKALITASGTQVEQGVRLVDETGRALTRIVTQVEKLSGLAGHIANSAQEQASGLGQVNEAIAQMDKVTQQNAAMVEEATAASHTLSAEAEELSRLVAQFRVAGIAESASHGDMAARPETAQAPAPKIGGFVAFPVMSDSSVLLKTAEEAWDEF